MPDIDILVPYATTNYILNPSVENNTTGWTAVGGAISAVLTRARFGRKSLQVVTNGAVVNEGVFYRIEDTSVKGMVFASVYVRGAGKVRLKIKDGFTGTVYQTNAVDLHDNYWQRLSVQGYADGTNDLRLYVETVDTAQLVTFYVDGAQIESGAYLSSYCDGDQDGCRWNGVKHASTSQRPASSADGGRWVSIRDDTCEPNTYITTFSGLGLPPITINRQRMAQSPGSFFDSERAEERVIQFSVNIIDQSAQRRNGIEKTNLYIQRQHLINLIKPDRDPNTSPMWMRYRDGDRSLMIRVLYESGLEFESDFRNKWINAIPLRFLALDPFWYEDDQEVAVLDTETDLNDVFIFSQRENGLWKTVGQGFSDDAGLADSITTIEEDANGNIYLGGTFTTDGDGNNMRKLAMLSSDYGTINEIRDGLNDTVNVIKAHPNGKIYIGGDFTNDNVGNVYNRIVEYDPSTGTFSALGTGLDDDVLDIDIDENGEVYAVGRFTTAGGVAANRVAKWDGGVWERVGDIIADLGLVGIITVTTIIVKKSTEIYVGGGLDTTRAATFDGTTWTELGTASTSLDGDANVMAEKVNGNLVLLVDSGKVFEWNGSSFQQLGDSFARSDGGVILNNIAVANNDLIYVVGAFDSIGDVTVSNGFAVWNGSIWSMADFDSDRTGQSVHVRENGDIFLGLLATGGAAAPANAVGSGITSVFSRNTSFVFPIVTFSGAGLILWLENQTTGQIVYLNYSLQAAETLEIDFRTGIKTVKSNFIGNVPNAILPNSSDFTLLSHDIDGNRENKIACFIINEVEPVVQLRYQPTHWSVDALSDL